MATCDPPLGVDTSLASSFVLVEQRRTWDDAQDYCRVCLGGRLAVLDTCHKNEAAGAAAAPHRALQLVARATGALVGASTLPFAAAAAPLLEDMDTLALPDAHIGLRTASTGLGGHQFRWFCPAAGGGESRPCESGEAGGVLSPTVEQGSVHAAGGAWGWNVLDRTFLARPAARDGPALGYMHRGMWDDDTQVDAERYFVCEYDEALRPPPSEGGEWARVCSPR